MSFTEDSRLQDDGKCIRFRDKNGEHKLSLLPCGMTGAKGIEAQHNNQLAVADLVLQEVLYEDRPLVRRLIFAPAQTQGLDGDGI